MNQLRGPSAIVRRLERLLFTDDFMLDIVLRFSKVAEEETERWLWRRQNCLAILRATDQQRTHWFLGADVPVFQCLKKTLQWEVHEAELHMLGDKLGGWVQAWLFLLMTIWAKVRFHCGQRS